MGALEERFSVIQPRYDGEYNQAQEPQSFTSLEQMRRVASFRFQATSSDHSLLSVSPMQSQRQ